MRKIKNLIGLIALVLTVIVSCKEAKNQKDETYANIEAAGSCLADPAWFKFINNERQTPPPKEGEKSVFGNNDSVSNCNFHQWSWQKFLWLTNKGANGKPVFLDSLMQVDNQNTQIHNKFIILESEKENDVQATGDILNTNKAFSGDNNTSYPVYYSIHANRTLYNSIQTYAKMDKSKYVNATFPVGSLELKIAWVDARAIKDSRSYFITDAIVNSKITKIALLGMHVVGIVYNHPEFIWATFEHHDLAPYYDWEATTTSDIPVTSNTNKLFFSKGAKATIANLKSNMPNDSLNVFAVNKYGVPRQAKNTFLLTSQAEPENYNNIESINNSVRSQLSDTDIWRNYFYNGSIWINTEGASYPTEQAKLLVSLGSSLSDSQKGKLPRGSVAAYNITMETYEQLGFNPPASIHQQSVKGMGNCFSCHSASKGSSLNISHLFNGAVLKQTNKLTPKQTKQIHLDELKLFIKKMNKVK